MDIEREIERKERETGGAFQSLKFSAPTSWQTRYMDLPATPEAATWECEVCGTIEPTRMFFFEVTRYAKRQCACQKADRERKEQEAQRKTWLMAQSRRTYNWLGGRWSDIGLREKTFESFDVSRQPDAYTMVRTYARSVTGTLVLHGEYGTGKTHLLAALCNAILYRPKPITSLFTTSPNLFAAVQSRIQANEPYYDLIDCAIHAQLLVIDDIDKAKHSEFREEVYYEIIDGRVKAGRPTAISTNRLNDLASFVGGAVCSRLKVGQVAVEMSGEDYREEL